MMYEFNLPNRFLNILIKSNVLLSDDVDYRQIQKDIEDFFIKNGFIAKNELEIRNGKLFNAPYVFRRLFTNLNLTNDETEQVLQSVEQYLYDFMMSVYKDMDTSVVGHRKRYFISNMFENCLHFIEKTMLIFDQPLFDFLIRFLKQTKMWYDDDIAEIIYNLLHTKAPQHKNKVVYDVIDDFFSKSWTRYSKIVLEHSNLFNEQ